MSHEEMARAWYAIRLDEIVERCVQAIRPFVKPTAPLSVVRSTLDGLLRGLVSAIFTPPTAKLYIRSVGMEVAEFCDGRPEAFGAFGEALHAAMLLELPEAFIGEIGPRFGPLYAEVLWGYVAASERRDRVRERETQVVHGMDPRYRQAPEWYLGFFEQSPTPIAVYDSASGRMVAANPAMEELFGYTLAEWDAIDATALLGPESPDGDHDVSNDLAAGKIRTQVRTEAYRHKDGHMVWVHSVAWLVRDANDEPTQIAYSFMPMEEHGLTHWQQADRRYRYLAQLSPDPLFVVRRDGMIQYASPATQVALGMLPEELIDTPIRDLVLEADHAIITNFGDELDEAPRHLRRCELRLVRRDGQWRWFELTGSNMMDVPDVLGFSVQARDISDRKRVEELLVEQSVIDDLTGLLNRRGVMSHLERVLAGSEAQRQTTCVIYLDLDGFKVVNDQFGHQRGDVVLNEIGRRLGRAVGGNAVAARLGGDEFVILMQDADPDMAKRFAQELLGIVSDPIVIGKLVTRVSGSFGIAFVRPSDDVRSLLDAADAALYVAKSARDGVPVIYGEGGI